jgi:hypothetical protein
MQSSWGHARFLSRAVALNSISLGQRHYKECFNTVNGPVGRLFPGD